MNAMLPLVSVLMLLGWQQPNLVGQEAATAAGGAEISAATAAPVVVLHCEVWSVSDAGLSGQIEARSAQAPADAEAIRELVAPGTGCQRLARVLAPMKGGQELSYGLRYEKPNVSVQTTARGTSQTSFSSYSKATTEFKLRCDVEGELITTQLSIQIEAFEDSDLKGMPPPKTSVHLSCGSSAPSGVLRAFQFEGKDHRMLIVFVRTTGA